MPRIESEVYRAKTGALVASITVPEEPGRYPIADSVFDIVKVIPGKRNGEKSVKAVVTRFHPPFSVDNRTQRFTFNGRPSKAVPPEAENTLAGGQYKARLRLTK